MNQNRLFQQTRRQLALWFIVVMGTILMICEFSLYQMVAHAHRVTVDRELTSVANTIHNGFSTFLTQPGKLEPEISRLLPDICLNGDLSEGEVLRNRCMKVNNSLPQIGIIYQIEYYVRLLALDRNLLATAGSKFNNLPISRSYLKWQNLRDEQSLPYRQISIVLHTQDNRVWGYLQVGRSLRDFRDYLGTIRWILILGYPAAMILVTIGAWWWVGKAMQPIYRSYRQIQQFTADAAHELRTPLAAIRATVESSLMRSRLNEDSVRNTLNTVNRQNQRLSQIVNDLLILSRLDRQRSLLTSIPNESVILNDLVSDIAEEYAALAVTANLQLRLQIDTSRTLEVTGNSEQLYRLVSNLVTNAINYTPEGGEVTIILKSESNDAVIRIRDTGIGIAKPEQKRIFDRFYRVDSDRSRQTGGSGLGLAIAMAIATAHRGSIELESELGRGSTFTVKLPKID